jgi:hypothetical protein
MKQLLLLLIVLPLLVQGQVKEFPYHPDDFRNELGAFMKANNNEEGKQAFELFSEQLVAGTIGGFVQRYAKKENARHTQLF